MRREINDTAPKAKSRIPILGVVAVVAVNVSYEPADFNFSLEGKGAENLKKVSAFMTSESANLTNLRIDPKFDGKRTFKLSPRSATTLLFE